MHTTKQTKAALKAMIAALGVSTMLVASAPAHAGPLGFLKKAAKEELKRAAHDRLADAAGDGVADLVVGAGAGSPLATGEHEVEYDIGKAPLKLVQNGTTVATADEVQAPQSEAGDTFLYVEGSSRTIKPTFKIEKGAAAAAAGDGHEQWIPIESMSGAAGYRGGVFVASGDVNGDGRDDIIVGPGLCKLVQNGTTVATADEVLAPLTDEERVRWGEVEKTHNMTATCAKLVQNGTTVATAGELLAPGGGEPIALLLPAVQAAREAARPARAGLSQNHGTTVPSADTLEAPRPAARRTQGRVPAIPARAGMSQNGTTVPSADTVKAPETDGALAAGYLKICGVDGE